MRSRVNDRLARATQFPITLIVAPAGFGKSVALRDFLLSSRSEVVRFDVRREDDTLLGFARRLGEAIKPFAPGASASFAGLQDRVFASSDPPRLVCDWFAEHLRRTLGTIVVDDLHFAAADPASIAFLAQLIEKTCERIGWILATRSDAGLPVATWLAYGRMDLPIDQNDLRFTLDEALAAAQSAQTTAESSEIEALWELTEGWPVALAIALRTHVHPADLRVAATRELVYRYLAEQVFTRVSESQREFLLATSVFSTFDAGIARELGGTAEFIADLRHGVAFLSETSPGQYRYHDLFRDYLESELMRRGEDAWHKALADAAGMLEEREHLTAALALYAKAKDARSILRLIERDGFALLERGQADALAVALEAVPDELRRESPAALGVQATLESARGHFEPASKAFLAAIERAASDELRFSLVHRYAIELVRHGEDCIALLEPYAGNERVPSAVRVPLMGTLATAYARASRKDDALATIAKALELFEPTAGDDARARIYQQAAFVYSQHDDQHDGAKRYAMLSVELAQSRNLYDVAMRAYSALYVVAYEDSDDPIGCLGILDKLLDCARKGASEQGRLYGLIVSYDIEADRGNEAALDRIERLISEIPGMLAQNRDELLPAMALRAAWHGDFRRAYELVLRAGELGTDERRAECLAEVALYASAAGLREEAESANERAHAALERWNRPTRRAVRARLVLALFELTRGRTASAHRHLTRAQRDLTPAMARLEAVFNCATMLYRRALGQADRALLAGAIERLRAEEFGGMARLIEALPLPQAAQGGYASLSATEREILQLLVAGGSTKDLAEQTSRSPRTIDTHIRSICKKLNCRSRRAAVALAIGAGWVQNSEA